MAGMPARSGVYDHTARQWRYNVYDNNTDMPVVIDGSARKCAEVMGVKLNTFYQLRTRHKRSQETGKKVKWWIERAEPEEEYTDE